MFRIFTRSWGVFLYSLLTVLLCGSYEVGACIATPDEIKVPGSTFTEERITAGRTLLRGISSAFSISFGNTNVYHNESKCLHQWKAEAERKQSGQLIPIRISKNGRFLELIEFNDREKKLWVYSMSGKQKASNKPYLEFHEHEPFCNGKRPIGQPCPEGVNLTVTAYAYEGGRSIGVYVSRYNPNGPQARGLGASASQQGQRHTGVVYLGNNKHFSSSGCHVSVR